MRLGSIEPVIITEDFVRRAARLEKLCPQFHLSLQSGCTATLRRMRRRYTAEEYRRAVELLRSEIDDVSITTDLMVGFPGETDEEFESSYRFCKSIGFMHMHVFKYSVRHGTAAEKMENQISESVKEARSAKMIELSEKMKKAFYDKYRGTEAEVLVEQRTRDGRYHATTSNYMDVYFDSPDELRGKIIKVTL